MCAQFERHLLHEAIASYKTNQSNQNQKQPFELSVFEQMQVDDQIQWLNLNFTLLMEPELINYFDKFLNLLNIIRTTYECNSYAIYP